MFSSGLAMILEKSPEQNALIESIALEKKLGRSRRECR